MEKILYIQINDILPVSKSEDVIIKDCRHIDDFCLCVGYELLADLYAEDNVLLYKLLDPSKVLEYYGNQYPEKFNMLMSQWYSILLELLKCDENKQFKFIFSDEFTVWLIDSGNIYFQQIGERLKEKNNKLVFEASDLRKYIINTIIEEIKNVLYGEINIFTFSSNEIDKSAAIIKWICTKGVGGGHYAYENFVFLQNEDFLISRLESYKAFKLCDYSLGQLQNDLILNENNEYIPRVGCCISFNEEGICDSISCTQIFSSEVEDLFAIIWGKDIYENKYNFALKHLPIKRKNNFINAVFNIINELNKPLYSSFGVIADYLIKNRGFKILVKPYKGDKFYKSILYKFTSSFLCLLKFSQRTNNCTLETFESQNYSLDRIVVYGPKSKIFKNILTLLQNVKNGRSQKCKSLEYITCSHCQGTGVEKGGRKEICPQCHGKQTVITEIDSIFGKLQKQEICPKCDGEGYIIKNKCHFCDGSGVQKEEEFFDVSDITDDSIREIINSVICKYY